MQESLGTSVSMQVNDLGPRDGQAPAPPKAPGEFLVRLGEGWGGSLHELADALAVWREGPVAGVMSVGNRP